MLRSALLNVNILSSDILNECFSGCLGGVNSKLLTRHVIIPDPEYPHSNIVLPPSTTIVLCTDRYIVVSTALKWNSVITDICLDHNSVSAIKSNSMPMPGLTCLSN